MSQWALQLVVEQLLCLCSRYSTAARTRDIHTNGIVMLHMSHYLWGKHIGHIHGFKVIGHNIFPINNGGSTTARTRGGWNYLPFVFCLFAQCLLPFVYCLLLFVFFTW